MMVSEILQQVYRGILHTVYSLDFPFLNLLVEENAGPFGVDTSIEGMRSQEFSVAIFYFLIASIIVFTIFVFLFMTKSKSTLKKGEKILFAWIFLGIVIAVIFGAAQMLHGYLF
jgi:uncharacterized membrane protein